MSRGDWEKTGAGHTVKSRPCKVRRCRTNWIAYRLLGEDSRERLFDVYIGPRTALFISLKPSDRGPCFGLCGECRSRTEAIDRSVESMLGGEQ